MLTFIFSILMIMVFGRILLFTFRATWGIARILFSLIILPIVLLGLVFNGLMIIALPVLLIIGLLTVLVTAD